MRLLILLAILLLPQTLLADNGHSLSEAAQPASSGERLMLEQRLQRLHEQQQQLQQERSRLEESRHNLDRQIDALGNSLLLSRVLYEHYQQLPRVALDRRLNEEIAALRLRQFDLERGLLLASQRGEDISVVQEQLRLLDQLISIALDVEHQQRQLLEQQRATRQHIEEKLFWMPITPPLSTSWLTRLPADLLTQLQPPAPATLAAALRQPGLFWLAGLPSLLLALVILARYRRLEARIDRLHGEIGDLHRDTQQHTPLAILLVAIKGAPLSLLLMSVGLPLRLGGEGMVALSGGLLLKLALLWFVIAWCRRLLRRNGIAENHFFWPPKQVRKLSRLIVSAGLLLTPLTMIFALGARAPEHLAADRLGQLIVLILAPLLAMILARASMVRGIGGEGRLLRVATAITLGGLTLLLAVMTALGYYYTALRLGDRLLDSFYLLLLWLLAAAAINRSLAVASRRLDYRNAVRENEARAAAREAESRDGNEAVEIIEPPLDLAIANTQSMRLARLLLLIIFLPAFYWVWADLVPAFAYMENIVLWQQVVGDGEQATVISTTLASVLTGLLLLVITLILARNLPGLLEMLVLSRLDLKPGSAYAITSLLSYTITAIGLIFALSALGVSWVKLQWLVAALGVGLGFGLQEIFGNFISGLIILFEKPIRVGDVVTIGDLSGTVSRIRIRATTITDFDRKDIIVPNKAFITDRLVNWSLTDSVTRLVLKIGFAYGSDLEKVRAILLQAAADNERVMREPEPKAYFLGFGASTLDHELRVHVSQLSDRIPTTDELNRRIDQLCREQGVEIAFSQLDVHIRSDVTRAAPDGEGPDGNT